MSYRTQSSGAILHTRMEPPQAATGTLARHDSHALRLWATVPPEQAGKLRPLSDVLVREVLQEIQSSVHAYSRLAEGRFRKALMHVIETAIHECFDAILRPQGQRTDWKAVFRRAGEAEFVHGRTTEPLQAALRIGARVVWRHISAHAPAIGVPAKALSIMAEAIFTWVDELSAVAIAGHHEAQARAHAKDSPPNERAASRQQLTRAILSGEPSDQEWVRALAQAAHWPLPDQVLPIAVERRSEHDELIDIAAHHEALVDVKSTTMTVLLPDPGRDRERVSNLLGGRRAAVGPAVGPAEAHRSLLLARRLLGLIQTKGDPSARIAWCQDNLATLLLLADPFLTARLQEHIEAAFAELTHKQRDRMAPTLLAWLQRCGTHNEIAARLDVHPQTFRYRVHQLQDLFGDKLADPDARLAMELALRARMLLDPDHGGALQSLIR